MSSPYSSTARSTSGGATRSSIPAEWECTVSAEKTIYSLLDLREILAACNGRYLEFLSALEDPSAGARVTWYEASPSTMTSVR
ncbi:MAG: hypothetical protein ACREU9_11345 [Gammaproteobacteria bacterium]